MRSLATIRRIQKLTPIKDADAIECALIDGWQVVVKKNEFKEGDLVVYFEIDSFIPSSIAPFLTKDGHFPKEYNGVQGERLKTVKLRGQISQGLALPVETVFPTSEGILDEGADVTEVLGIVKYEPPVPAQLAGVVRGNFPSFIRKTDQERIQNLTKFLPRWIEEYHSWEITEKLDGSSMTVFVNKDDSGVCSRNLMLKETESNTFWVVANKFDLINKIKQTGRNLAIQGELVGEGVQQNKYGLVGHHFYLFDIFDIDTGNYLPPSERIELATKLNINHVPILNNSYVLSSNETVQSLLEMAESKSVLNENREREGIVFKRSDGSTSFKAISNKFLLKYE